VTLRNANATPHERLTDLAIVASAGLVAIGVVIALAEAPHRSVWNGIRIAPAMSLWYGYSLYYGPDAGPVSGNIYAPFASLAYLPATLASQPSVILQLGSVLSLAWYFAPVVWLAKAMAGRSRDHSQWLNQVLILLFVPIFTFLRPESLGYVACLIHADAPALGTGGMACALLYGTSPFARRTLAFSAGFAVLSVCSKQVMAPIALAIPMWLWFSAGRRAAIGWLLAFACFAACALVVSCLLFDWRALVFNVLTIPSRHPWDPARGTFPLNALNTFFEFLRYAWPVLVLLTLANARLDRSASKFQFLRSTWSLFAIVGFAVLPTSLLGRLKVGGDLNALSFSLYFLTFAAVLALADRIARGRKVLAWTALAIAAAFLARFQIERIAKLDFYRQSPSEIARDFVSNHAGEAYFPWNPLEHLLGEHHLYHQIYGVYDRDLARFPLSAEHLWAGVPRAPRMICFPENASRAYVHDYFPEYRTRIFSSELPGFECYVKGPSAP
jgi:hypothetical protein